MNFSGMKCLMKKLLFVLLACAAAFSASAQKNVTYSGNPVFPGDYADPAIIYHDGWWYIYITRQNDANVWRTKDFTNWKLTELNWPTSLKTGGMWAPGVARGADGKFYLYYTLKSQIYVGVAEHPMGPFRNLMPDEQPFIKDKEFFPPKIHSIDADCFVDDDGRAYLYWGSGWGFKDGVCAAAPLNADMASFAEAPKDITPQGYFEAPHMFKRGGRYYLMYSDGVFMDDSYKVRYAVSDSPMGPFVEGKNSPILVSDEKSKVHGPGHNFTFEAGGQMYIVYHKHEMPIYEQHRQICIDKMDFDDEGNILPIKPTDGGIALDFIKKPDRRIVHKPVRVEASSSRGDAYAAENAFDSRFGTLWAPEPGGVHWIFADFGRPVSIAGMEAYFDEIKGAHEYEIEYSSEANSTSPKSGNVVNWKKYYSGNNAEASEWPVEIDRKIKARFVRMKISKTDSPRFGLWEWKIYEKMGK